MTEKDFVIRYRAALREAERVREELSYHWKGEAASKWADAAKELEEEMRETERWLSEWARM